MQLLKIPTMLVRVCFVVNLILGVAFWTGRLDAAQGLHILLGIVMVLSLFWLAVTNIQQKGSPVITVLAFVDGIALYVVGVGQANWLNGSAHWLIQVVHLLLAVLAIGFAEMISARLPQGSQTTPAAR